MMKTMLWISALSLVCYSAPGNALTCTVTATSPHAFGNYDPLSGNTATATNDITVDCSGLLGLLVSVTVSLSTGSSGSYAPRKMYKGSDTLDYNLYTNIGHSTVWGDGSSGTSTVAYTLLLPLLGASRTDTVYGLVPANQTTTVVGSYSDTITVTIDYFGL